MVQRPGPRHIGVAHRPPGPVQGLGQPLPGRVEGQPDQRPGLLVAAEHGRPQPTGEPQPLPRRQRRRRRPGVGRHQRRVAPVPRHPQHQRRPALPSLAASRTSSGAPAVWPSRLAGRVRESLTTSRSPCSSSQGSSWKRWCSTDPVARSTSSRRTWSRRSPRASGAPPPPAPVGAGTGPRCAPPSPTPSRPRSRRPPGAGRCPGRRWRRWPGGRTPRCGPRAGPGWPGRRRAGRPRAWRWPCRPGRRR